MKIMTASSLKELKIQLDSDNLRDRKLALLALRNFSPKKAMPLLKKALQDRNQQVRSMAIFALGVKPTEESFSLLVNLLETDPDYGIRADSAGALGYLRDLRAFEPLVRAFYEDPDWLVRFSAAVSLGNLRDQRAHDVLLQALDSAEVLIQQAAIAALGEIKDLSAVTDILRFAGSEDWLVRQRLAEALGHLPCSKSQSALRYLAKDPHPNVAQAAALALDNLSFSQINPQNA